MKREGKGLPKRGKEKKRKEREGPSQKRDSEEVRQTAGADICSAATNPVNAPMVWFCSNANNVLQSFVFINCTAHLCVNYISIIYYIIIEYVNLIQAHLELS